jgi:hypothetical protein
MNGACTLLRIFGDNLVAGTRLGDLACWSISSGLERWKIFMEGPCSDCDLEDDLLCVSESDNLHAVDLRTGKFLWSSELVGSSDFVRVSGGGIWATSSVYTIEIQDYSQATVWLFDIKGRLQGKWGVDGRAWFLAAKSELAIIGLSRPRCGYANMSLGHDPAYISLDNNSPITTGAVSEEGVLYLGHSDGGVSEIIGEEVASHNAGLSAVTALAVGKDWVAGLESGQVASGTSPGGWSSELGGFVDVVSLGPSLNGGRCVWSSSWSEGAKLTLLDEDSGTTQFEVNHDFRIEKICSTGGTIALGDSEGNVFLFEEAVFRRRFEQVGEDVEEDQKRSLLRRQIRSLRQR